MAEPLETKDGAWALVLVAIGIGAVFVAFRFYCRWKFKQMAQVAH